MFFQEQTERVARKRVWQYERQAAGSQTREPSRAIGAAFGIGQLSIYCEAVLGKNLTFHGVEYERMNVLRFGVALEPRQLARQQETHAHPHRIDVWRRDDEPTTGSEMLRREREDRFWIGHVLENFDRCDQIEGAQFSALALRDIALNEGG